MKYQISVNYDKDKPSFVCPFCRITYQCPFLTSDRIKPLFVVKQHLHGEQYSCPKLPQDQKEKYIVKGTTVELELVPNRHRPQRLTEKRLETP